MKTRQYFLAAVAVAGISIIAAGCGGGGGGGGGGQQPPGQQPPPPQSPPVLTSASVTPTDSTNTSFRVDWTGTDAQNDPLSAFVRPAQGAPVQFSPTAPTSAASFTFTPTPVTTDTTTTVEVCLTDGQNALVTQSFSILVKAPVSGPPTPPPATAPAITGVDTFNAPILTNTNNQVVEVSVNLTGVTFANITATVDGQTATTVRNFTTGSFRLKLPRLSTPGPKQLALNFPGLGTSTNTTLINYQNVGDSWMFSDYSDNTVLNRGRVVRCKTDNLGVASNVTDLIAANGHTNVGLAEGSSRSKVWVAGKDGGIMKVFHADASVANGAVQYLDVTDGTTTSGLIKSISALRDGSKCVIAWIDNFNTKGQGNDVWWLSVLDIDPGNNKPRVIKEIPLSQAGKIAANVDMTPVRTVTLMISTGTTIGGGLKQDYAVLGQQTAPYKLFLVPLESTGVDYHRYDLTVLPQVIECFEDEHQKLLQMVVVGQTGAQVQYENMLVTNANPTGFSGAKFINAATQNVIGAYFRNGTVAGNPVVLMGLVLDNFATVSLYNMSTTPNPTFMSSHSFPGAMITRGTAPSRGNAWFSVFGREAAGSRLFIIQPDFTTKRDEPIAGQINTICATENDVFVDARTLDNMVVVGQTGTATPQTKPQSTAIGASSGVDPRMRVTSRSLAR